MKKKVLMVASMGSMIAQFNLENLKLLKNMGFNIEVACNLTAIDPMSDDRRKSMLDFFEKNKIIYHNIDFNRGIGNINSNISNYTALLELCQNGKYDFIHTHSPLASVISRLVAKKLSIPVIYTAHGFQFFKGGRLRDWLLYYPIEWYLSAYTDSLITINNEDFNRAEKRMRAKNVFQIPGVGIDYKKFLKKNNLVRQEIRTNFDISNDEVLILSVGELSNRKNHQVVIKALSLLKDEKIKFFICGVGDQEKSLNQLIKDNGLEKLVRLLGYREDIDRLMNAADIFIFPSKREGLGLAGIEAMAAGLPILTSNVNGIKEYSKNGITGFMYSPNDITGFSDGIKILANDKNLRETIGVNNSMAAQKFDKSNARKIMEKVYSRYKEDHD